MKILILTLALVATASAGTTFEVIPKSSKPLFFAPVQEGVEVSYAVGYVPTRKGQEFAVPPDVGGNYGDNFWMEDRSSGDSLVIREIQINKINRDSEQFINWKVDVPGKIITHMRFMNIGRQRGYVHTVTATSKGGPTASAVIYVAAGYQIRLLVEVYAK